MLTAFISIGNALFHALFAAEAVHFAAAELEEKLRKNRFTLTDYLDQMAQLKKMGDLSSLLGMMPGKLGKQMEGAQVDEKQLARQEAIILSMTAKERENPGIIDASRKRRIAAGCGMEVVDVNRLLKQYEMMLQLTRQFAKGGGKNLPKNLADFGKPAKLPGSKMYGFGRKKRLK